MKMYENILEKVRLYEEKRGITYAKTDGKLYIGVKALYIISLVYTFGVNLLFLLGSLLSETVFKALENSIYTVIALSVALIAAWVVMGFKKHLWAHIVAFVLNTLACVGLGITFGRLLTDVIGFKAKFYYCHLVPLSLAVLCSIILTIIAVRAIIKTQKTYKIVVENLYNAQKAEDDGKAVSEEEWDEILKNI